MPVCAAGSSPRPRGNRPYVRPRTRRRSPPLHDKDIELCPKEFGLLAVLARRTGQAVSRETLMAEFRDEIRLGSSKTLDVTMAGLWRRPHRGRRHLGPPRQPAPHHLSAGRHGYRVAIRRTPPARR
ncbi:winged helix-turn-helix domain-containing protein [Streptomyces sp. NPDC058470]|uniref:winged helix-turn-helix domain-containing protein n=1 Tax=Streptomyces sp. NPDC058470 TaxID=3346515 RepID=UPI003659BF17